MPYIKRNQRPYFANALDTFPSIDSKGELEYCIFTLMVRYMENNVFNYTNLHDVAYAAQHCADEFRRRFLDVREDTARKENGDVGE
jgi:hypothetical protein